MDLGEFCHPILMVTMVTEISKNSSHNYCCEKCYYVTSSKGDFNKHLTTAKHKKVTNGDIKLLKTLRCECGKEFKYRQGLSRHKGTCNFKEDNVMIQIEENVVMQTDDIDKRDELIEQLVNSNTEIKEENREMKTLVMMMLEKYQESQLQTLETTREIMRESQLQNQENTKELVNKVIDVIPQMGNTTNNNTNNTLNFYLTNTCKDAESIHEFTERFVDRIATFFKDNYRDVAYKQINLPDYVRDIFFQCLDENPQTKNFVQTTDLKNGVVYIKEKRKDENYKLHGEAEFVKYIDGFQNAGLRIGHAINCGLLPCKSQCQPILESEFDQKPCEDDYEDDDDEQYEKDMDRYNKTTRAVRENILFQMINAMNIFDDKNVRENTLLKTKRPKIGNGA